MAKEEILDQIERYKTKKYFQRKQEGLKLAVQCLDTESIKELLQEGASIQELEKENSSLALALESYERIIFDINEKNRKKNHFRFDDYYRTLELENSPLSAELQLQIEKTMKNTISTLEMLYQNGADINYRTYLERPMENEIKPNDYVNIFELVCCNLGHFTYDTDIIKWIVSKEDLDIKQSANSNIISYFLNMNNSQSLEALQLVLERGLPLHVEHMGRVNITSLVDCLVRTDIKYRQEKFNLLWECATEEQRNELINNYHVNNIEIPQNGKNI